MTAFDNPKGITKGEGNIRYEENIIIDVSFRNDF